MVSYYKICLNLIENVLANSTNSYPFFVLVNLDIFLGVYHNEVKVKTEQDAWLAFLAVETAEDVLNLLEQYPHFKTYYQELFDLFADVEEGLRMFSFSKELQELDEGTMRYMVDTMQETIDSQAETIGTLTIQHEQDQALIEQLKKQLNVLKRGSN